MVEHSIPLTIYLFYFSFLILCIVLLNTVNQVCIYFINYFKTSDLFVSSHIHSACSAWILGLVFLLLSFGFRCLSTLILVCIFCSLLLLLCSVGFLHFSSTAFSQLPSSFLFIHVICYV